MPSTRILESFVFGGVDGRSNPLAFPPTRSLRCINFCPQPSQYLKLRYGYSAPAVAGTAVSAAIHSAFYFESVNQVSPGGNPQLQAIFFGAGANLYHLTIGASANTVTQITTLAGSGAAISFDGYPFGAFVANNKGFLCDGPTQIMTDGISAWKSGIRAPNGTETAGCSVTQITGYTGTLSTISPWSATTLTGYQFAMAYYNPLTGHVGNYRNIGKPLLLTGTQTIVQITGLPSLASLNTQLVKLLGRTPDGGTIPYALDDPISGAWVVAGNTATSATLTTSSADFTSALPTRNGLPPSSHAACYALGRVYWIDDTDPHLIDYSESEADLFGAASFVGRPEQSYSPLSQIPFPKNETCRCIQEYGNEAWVLTRNFLGILTELGGYSPEGIPSPQFRGTWIGGACGQRAFIKTPYGPFWVTPDRELMTWNVDGPIVASTEYQAALLGQLGTQYLTSLELGYFRDGKRDIDRLYIFGQDNNQNWLTIVHDFLIPPGGSGQGYQYQYSGISPAVFVREPDNVISMRDTTQRLRLWVASGAGFYQLEDGSISDNGASYTGDYVTLIDMGPEEPLLAGLEITGDAKVQVQGSFDNLGLTTAQMAALPLSTVTVLDAKTSRLRVEFDQGAQFALLRLQLSAHPADGYSLDLNPTPHLPLEVPGRIYVTRPEFGATRRVGGTRP